MHFQKIRALLMTMTKVDVFCFCRLHTHHNLLHCGYYRDHIPIYCCICRALLRLSCGLVHSFGGRDGPRFRTCWGRCTGLPRRSLSLAKRSSDQKVCHSFLEQLPSVAAWMWTSKLRPFGMLVLGGDSHSRITDISEDVCSGFRCDENAGRWNNA
jgi:hypothetical protein